LAHNIMKSQSVILATVPLAAAFTPNQRVRFGIGSPSSHDEPHPQSTSSLGAESAAIALPSKPIFDPLGLYPETSVERQSGLIAPLEGSDQVNKQVIDPLKLYQDKTEVSSVDMSISVPFLQRPALLDGTLPGDRGFDPLNLASSGDALHWQRKAEAKHGRLAMLASVGWLAAELLHKPLSGFLNLPSLLADAGRVPSVLNDGLSHTFPLFWVEVVTLAAIIEIPETIREDRMVRLDPTDLGWDPLGLLDGKTDDQTFFLKEAETFNGRLAMLAIAGFSAQEFLFKTPIVEQFPHLI